MANPQTCVIKSVTLQPGEPFNLPPGAEILFATDIANLSSTCPIPDNLEELECYIISIAAVSFNDRPPYNGDTGDGDITFWLRGIYAANQFYPKQLTAMENGVFPMGEYSTFMQNEPGLAGLFLDLGTGAAADSSKGANTTLCFKTTPSIAESMFIAADTTLIGVGTPEPDSWMRFYPIKRSDYIANNSNQTPLGTCNCA
jgi:hypothetical protein